MRDQFSKVITKKLRASECIVCGWNKKDMNNRPLTEMAHVKPVANSKIDDKESNMIRLCPNHHTEFDNLNFYIDINEFGKYIFVFRDIDDEFHKKVSIGDIKYIKKEYITYRKILFDKRK